MRAGQCVVFGGRFGTGPDHDKGKSCHGWVNCTTLRASVHAMNSAFY
jgi:hypothetical protein